MEKNNNVVTIVILAITVVAITGLLVWAATNNKNSAPVNKANAPAVDQHGHPMAGGASASFDLNELMDKSAPEFSLTDKDGKVYSSENLRGKNVILFFNEGLMCYPACWDQIVALAKDARFKNADTVVLSVVVDPPEEWQKATKQMPELAEATVVFDKGAEASNKFGMLKTASSMHPGSLPGHSYTVIDKEGIIRYVLDDPNMAIRNDQLAAELSKLNQK